uniref:Uncharacterized protein n=1 Tax=Haemonchus contortus TaxID=6289 RepID=W6NG79_HAECO
MSSVMCVLTRTRTPPTPPLTHVSGISSSPVSGQRAADDAFPSRVVLPSSGGSRRFKGTRFIYTTVFGIWVPTSNSPDSDIGTGSIPSSQLHEVGYSTKNKENALKVSGYRPHPHAHHSRMHGHT